ARLGTDTRLARADLLIDRRDHRVEIRCVRNRWCDDLRPPVGQQSRQLELFGAVGLDRPVAGDGIDQRVVAAYRRDVDRSVVARGPLGVGTAVPRSTSRPPVTPTAPAIPSHTFHLPSPLVTSISRVPGAGRLV